MFEGLEDIGKSSETTNEKIASSGNEWYWDEGVPGSGERPSFLPSKFKTVVEAAKSFVELEKRIGTAPDQYDLSKAESWIDPDYEPFEEMAQYLKSRHVPQDAVDKVLESVGLYLDEFKTDIKAEREKLGENASERLRVLNNWAKSNLSESAYHALTSNLRTADAVLALEELRSKSLGNSVFVDGNPSEVATAKESIDDIKNEMRKNMDQYKKDEKYRDTIRARLEKALA